MKIFTFKRIFHILICLVLFYIPTACSIFGTSEGIPQAVTLPPKKVGANDLTTIVNVTPAELNNKNNANKKKTASLPTTTTANQQRIEEERKDGGVVSEIKVNNRDIPDYYIYPSQQQQDTTVINRPDMNVSTPNWQINW